MIFFRTEPQLMKLQKEYAEVEERKSSLRQVVQFLADLKELQHDYLNYREENPRKKVAVSIFLHVFELFWISLPSGGFFFWIDMRSYLHLAYIK